jgi:LmbE family N-acetylglucosaminyl deacetylase
VFVRLPDGRFNGTGFLGRGSLKQLWEGAIPAITSLGVSPPSPTYQASTYTRSGLIDALAWVLDRFQPVRIATQDYVGSVDGSGDHSDHRAGAQFVLAAARSYAHRATLVGYLDYEIQNDPPNLSGDDVARKQAAWFAYLPYDYVLKMSGTCQTVQSCMTHGNYGNYWSRQYRISPPIQLPETP